MTDEALFCEACERKYVAGPPCPACSLTEVCARCGWCDECADKTVNWPDEAESCDCPFDYPYTCPACGHERITNHCPHDGIQNPCPECGWTDPGKETPLQFLGVTLPPGAEEGERRS